MIRLFRKIRHKLLSENNYGTYILYASGEIVLVMLGILLALQVDSWHKAKKDRIEEKLVLTRLSIELSSNTEKLYHELEGFESKDRALEQVSKVFEERMIENDSLFLSTLITSSLWGWTVRPLQRLIFDEINNTGRLTIIQNIDIRDKITKLYNEIEMLEATAYARTSDYARKVYSMVPREIEWLLKQGLDPDEHRAFVEVVLDSDLDQLIIFEQNRTTYLKQVWHILLESIAEVRSEIEAELKE